MCCGFCVVIIILHFRKMVVLCFVGVLVGVVVDGVVVAGVVVVGGFRC